MCSRELYLPLLTIGATTEEEEQQQEPEPETPEVKEDTPEDSNQHPAAEVSPQEELQPEEQQFGEVQAQDTTQSEKEEPKEESSTVQDEAPPKPGEDVTEQKEEAVSTTTTEQEAPKDDAAEIQPAAAPKPAATTKGGDDQVSTEVKEIPATEPEETVKEKPKRPPRNKVRTTIPTEGVDLAIGEGPLEGAEPITFGQQFKDILKKYADVPALKWKVKEGEGEESVMVWKMASFAEYYKFCIDAAKSLIKVRHRFNFDTINTIVLSSVHAFQWRHNHTYIFNHTILFTHACSLVLRTTMVWASLVSTHQNGLSPTTLRSLQGKGQSTAACCVLSLSLSLILPH